MSTPAHFSELYKHMSWADATIWQAVFELQKDADNTAVREKLYHIHTVQHAYLQIWQNTEMTLPPLDTFADLTEIVRWAAEYYNNVGRFIAELDKAQLATTVDFPWKGHIEERFGKPVPAATVSQTLTQVYAHSSYHRGQVNAIIRTLGGEPPLTDFIAWIWQKSPAAKWEKVIRSGKPS